MLEVLVSGSFDDLDSLQIRLLQEAARQGPVRVLLWSDEAVQSVTGKPPRFGIDERRYLVGSLRYVQSLEIVYRPDAVPEGSLFHVRDESQLAGFPDDGPAAGIVAGREPLEARAQFLPTCPAGRPPGAQFLPTCPAGRRVVVSGCFDWLHSGHVRFFEEVSALGELYVVVGHDANVRLLKGDGHPRFPQEERRYVAQAVRFVHQALVSSGSGWMDAEPEILTIGANAYAVNEDGDKPEKREFCRQRGLEYIVLKRAPASGLPPRTSTDLRGF